MRIGRRRRASEGVADEVGSRRGEFGQDLPMSSRIIKVANAYDDLCGPDGDDHRAMERIHLGLGYEYDPRVVDSLTRVLDRRRGRSVGAGS